MNFFFKSDKKLIKEFFGISKSPYEIVYVKNELSHWDYGGDYKVGR